MNKRSLVLIPGLNNTHAVFARLSRFLEDRADLTVHALNNPPLDTVEAIAKAHLADLPERFWLAGFSFGGYVALAILAAAPERVQGIALLCSAPGADSPAAQAKRLASIETAEQGRYLEMVQASAASAFHPDHLSDAALMDERMRMVGDYGAQRFIAHVRASMARPDRSALLTGDRPTLVVGGSHDPLFTPQALAYADGIPGAQRVTIAQASHLAPMEQPAALAQALLNWMNLPESGAGEQSMP